REAAVLVRKIALALEEAHAKGVIHRDLKPSNVMIDRRGEPIVMDFGLAREVNAAANQTQAGALLGTPADSSPGRAPAEAGGRAGPRLRRLLAGRRAVRAAHRARAVRRAHAGGDRPAAARRAAAAVGAAAGAGRADRVDLSQGDGEGAQPPFPRHGRLRSGT